MRRAAAVIAVACVALGVAPARQADGLPTELRPAQAKSRALTIHRARLAVRDLVEGYLRNDEIWAYRLGRCHRETRRRVRCNLFVRETCAVPPAPADDCVSDSWNVMVIRKRRHHRISVRWRDWMYA